MTVSPSQMSLNLTSHQNQSLFSDHYLNDILRRSDKWRSVLPEAKVFLNWLRELYAQEKAQLPHYKESQLEDNWFKPIFDRLGHVWEGQAAVPGLKRTTKKPDFVFFPKTVQPFRIFEPRYLTMVKDAIAGERLITFTLLKADEGGTSNQSPPFEPSGTLGYINRVQEIEGGQQHILVTGLTKVDIAELDSTHSYRRGAVIPIRDFTTLSDGDKRKKELLSLFNAILEKTSADHSIDVLTSENIPLEMVAHIIVSALPIEAAEKQKASTGNRRYTKCRNGQERRCRL